MLTFLRRVVATLSLAGLVAVAANRFRTRGRTRPDERSWRELSGPDLR